MPIEPSNGMLEKIFGSSKKKRTTDIELPSEGQVDPRLKKKKKGIFDRNNPFSVLFDKIKEAKEK